MIVFLHHDPKHMNDGISGRLVLHVAYGGVFQEFIATACHAAVWIDNKNSRLTKIMTMKAVFKFIIHLKVIKKVTCLAWQTPPPLETDSRVCECLAAAVESNTEELCLFHCPTARGLFQPLYPSYDPEKTPKYVNICCIQSTGSKKKYFCCPQITKEDVHSWLAHKDMRLCQLIHLHTLRDANPHIHTVSCPITHKFPYLPENCIMTES